MCNAGRYIERNPGLRAAGLPGTCGQQGILDSMKVYPRAELAEVWHKSMCPKKPKALLFPTQHIIQNDTIQEVLASELKKSRFAKFKEQFFEDLYLKKPELGKSKPAHSIPESVTNESQSFGMKYDYVDNAYDLILPPRSVAEINKEYTDWHCKYIISHQHYFPGEKISRNYNENFKPKACFGEYKNADVTGAGMRRCLISRDNLSVVKKLQHYYLERNFGEVGKKISRFKDPHLEDPNRVYGRKAIGDKCQLRDVVHNIDPCEEPNNSNLLEAVSYLIRQRALLQKNAQFDVFALEKSLEKYDLDKTGYVPLTEAFHAARTQHIYLNEQKMREALIFYKLVEDVGLPTERIKIWDFSKTLQFRYLLPDIAVKRSIPGYKLDTTYRDMCNDYTKPPPPIIPHYKKRVEIKEDNSSPEAFNRPREKAQLKRIFSDIVCSDIFDKIWEQIMNKREPNAEKDNLVSIDEIRVELKSYYQTRELQAT